MTGTFLTSLQLAQKALELAYLGFNPYFSNLERLNKGMENVIEPIRKLGTLNLEYLYGCKFDPAVPKHPALPTFAPTPHSLEEIGSFRLPALHMSYVSLQAYFEHPRSKVNPYDDSLAVLFGLADSNVRHLKYLNETSTTLLARPASGEIKVPSQEDDHAQ